MTLFHNNIKIIKIWRRHFYKYKAISLYTSKSEYILKTLQFFFPLIELIDMIIFFINCVQLLVWWDVTLHCPFERQENSNTC